MKKNWISWIVTQDGETMVIVLLMIAVMVLSIIVVNFNRKLDACSEERFKTQMEYTKKLEEQTQLEKQKYEEKIEELRNDYNERFNEIKTLKNEINKTIGDAKEQLEH